jgi:protocatechuate 3,4-dioxygenase, beta subunit
MRTPDQVLGPYYPMQATPVTGGDLTYTDKHVGRAVGEVIEIVGQVIDLAREPVGEVRILVWQANCFGRYAHPNDLASDAPLDPNFMGFGEVRSSADGTYRIRTVKPGSYPALEGWTRAPHIHFEVCGQFEKLITQMYFPGEPLNQEDRFLLSSRKPELLIARPSTSDLLAGGRALRFDIVLARG